MQSFRFPRTAALVPEEFDPERVACGSYDLASHGPTLEALRRFKAHGTLPRPTVPGKYAAVVYEEAALERHGRVGHLLRGEAHLAPRPDALPALRALAFIEVESFLQGILEPCEEAVAIVPGLLALPAILDGHWRRALAEDALGYLVSNRPELRPSDRFAFDLAVPALVAAAGLGEPSTQGLTGLIDASAVEAITAILLREFDSGQHASREEAVAALSSLPGLRVDILGGWLHGAWTPEVFADDEPIFKDNYDQIHALLEHWCPSFAAHLRAPQEFTFPDSGILARATPLRDNPLWLHGVETR